MNRLLFFLFFKTFVALTFATYPQGTVPSLSDNTTCFLFVSKKQPFFVAEEYCNQKGGHLTSIHNAFDNALVRENAQQNFTDSTNADFWVGLNDLKNSGTWGWIDGSSLDFAEWDKGQPNNTPGYDCGAVNLQGGRWVSEDCDNDRPFVCSIKIAETTSSTTTIVAPTKPSITCPDSWTYFSVTGFCYIVEDIAAIWNDAEQNCFDRGGHLASIHSLSENAFITNLIPFDPNDHKCDEPNFAWIGLYTLTVQRSWNWIDDSPFNYSAWAPGRPAYTTAGYAHFCSYAASLLFSALFFSLLLKKKKEQRKEETQRKSKSVQNEP